MTNDRPKYLEGIDHRNPPKPYPDDADTATPEHPNYKSSGKSSAIDPFNPPKPYPPKEVSNES